MTLAVFDFEDINRRMNRKPDTVKSEGAAPNSLNTQQWWVPLTGAASGNPNTSTSGSTSNVAPVVFAGPPRKDFLMSADVIWGTDFKAKRRAPDTGETLEQMAARIWDDIVLPSITDTTPCEYCPQDSDPA